MFDLAAGGGTSNPFIVFTFIVAPAILTNASTLMVLSTGTRINITIERGRDLARQVVKAREQKDSSLLERLERELDAAEKRTAILLRAIRSFYISLGSFAFSVCVALLGAGLVSFSIGGLDRILGFFALLGVFLGVVGLVAGSAMLFVETRITVHVLQDRITRLIASRTQKE